MKHNGVVTRILKTSSATSAGTAGGASKARPATPAATPSPLASDGATVRASAAAAPSAQATQAVDDEVDNLFAGMGDDLAKEAEQTPVPLLRTWRRIKTPKTVGAILRSFRPPMCSDRKCCDCRLTDLELSGAPRC